MGRHVKKVFVFLCICLLSSSNSWYLGDGSAPYPLQQQLRYSRVVHGDLNPLPALTESAWERKDQYWLSVAADLGDPLALYYLSDLLPEQASSKHWLRKAAEAGVAAAQFDWSLMVEDQADKLAFLSASAAQGYMAAQHALGNWLLLNQRDAEAEKWLRLTATTYPNDAFALANLSWRQNNESDAITSYQIASEQGHQTASRFLDVLQTQQRLNIDSLDEFVPEFITHSNALNETCSFRILSLSVGLANQVQAMDFIKQVRQDPRLKSLPMCFSDPIWLALEDTLCQQQQLGGRARIQCDVTRLASIIGSHAVTHVVLFLDQGRAYVDAGIMYLNLLSSYSVFVHELAHFAGFADEYPISRTLAKVHCVQQTAPNLLFDGDITYAPQQRIDYWREVNVDKGLSIYPARTCSNINVPAYKMTDERTFMEFHDTNLIPQPYREIWKDQISTKAHWYPVAINIARYYEQLNNPMQAQHWRQIARDQKMSSQTKAPSL